MTTTESLRTELPLWMPSARMYCNNDQQVFKLELPGVARDSIWIDVDHDDLVVSAIGKDRRFFWRHALHCHTGIEHIQTVWHEGTLEIDVPSR